MEYPSYVVRLHCPSRDCYSTLAGPFFSKEDAEEYGRRFDVWWRENESREILSPKMMDVLDEQGWGYPSTYVTRTEHTPEDEAFTPDVVLDIRYVLPDGIGENSLRVECAIQVIGVFDPVDVDLSF